ncbi:phosphate transporter PhoU [Thermococcus sp.]
MKSRLFREIQNLFEELGNSAMDALCPERIGDEVRTEELLWKAADLREKLNDKTIEALIRYQPLARDMRFIRAVLGSTYDTYRVVRHASRINVVLNISPDEKAEHVARDVFNLIRPWLNHGISAISRDARIPVDDLPFFESSFEELWEHFSKTDDPKIMAVLIHGEGIFNHTKHILSSALYYQLGRKGLEKSPILLIT